MRYLKGIPEDFIKEKYRYDPMSPSGLMQICSHHLDVKPVGTLSDLGYWKVSCTHNGNRINLRAHRVVFLLCTDIDIEGLQIDHVDNDRSNNKFENLRACTKLQNDWNRKATRPTNTGIKGLCENTKNRLFAARVTSEKKSYRKVFRYSVNSTDAQKEEVKAKAVLWLRETRELLHGPFCNHGGEDSGAA